MVSRELSYLLSSLVAVGLVYYLFRPEVAIEKESMLGGLGLSKEEREMFIPTSEWKAVGDQHICPAGLEYKLNLTDGTKFARFIA